MLLVGYIHAYLKRLEHWLRAWGIAISVSTSTTTLFVEAARVSQNLDMYGSLGNQSTGSIQVGIWRDCKPSNGCFSFLLAVLS
jgi:hypothetical protein